MHHQTSGSNSYALRRHISLGTEVRRAAPEADGWRVELASGEVRHYAGVIACPGVTWHGVTPDLPPDLPGAAGFDAVSAIASPGVTQRSFAASGC